MGTDDRADFSELCDNIILYKLVIQLFKKKFDHSFFGGKSDISLMSV